MAEPRDVGKDVNGGLRPDERLGMAVRLSDVALDRSFKVFRAGEGAAFQTAPGQQREPALNQVQPRRARGGEMLVKPRMSPDRHFGPG